MMLRCIITLKMYLFQLDGTIDNMKEDYYYLSNFNIFLKTIIEIMLVTLK